MITLFKAEGEIDEHMLLGLYDTALLKFGEGCFYSDGCFLYKVENGSLYFCDPEVNRLPLRRLIDE